MAGRGGSRRLLVATVAYALWAPWSLAGLPFAGLMAAARPRSPRQGRTALFVGACSVALLVAPGHDLVGGVIRAFTVLVSAAFLVLVVVAPTRFLTQALRAVLLGLGATLLVARVTLGPHAGALLQWAATREASETLGFLAAAGPGLYDALGSGLVGPLERFLGATVPAILVLQAFAGLALAWQWHERLALQPLGAPLAPFREFRFADAWVWAVVVAIAVWITPLFAGLRAPALNLLVVLGTFYLLRGAAIVAALAIGLPPALLAFGAAVSVVLVLPLFFLLPGLATLGVSDTWLEFRRRLDRRPNVS